METPVSMQFNVYTDTVYYLSQCLYAGLGIGTFCQMIRMRIYRNSINPQFAFFAMLYIGCLCMRPCVHLSDLIQFVLRAKLWTGSLSSRPPQNRFGIAKFRFSLVTWLHISLS